MANKEELASQAKISEQIERYDDMLDTMKKIVNLGEELSIEDRNLLSVAYKNSISGRRSAWRALESLEKKAESKGQTQQLAYIRDYKVKVRAELINICNDLIQLLDKTLIPGSLKPDAKVFYHKMQGDYFRYTSEVYAKTDAQYTKAGDSASAAYNEATIIGETLPQTHPIRLGLALNYSVFHYQVKNDPQTACQLAKRAFDQAIADIDNISEEQYKDATTIMQLIRDNLTLWTAQAEQESA